MERKPKIIDFDQETKVALSIQAVKLGAGNLKAYCEEILKEVGSVGAYNTLLIKKLKLLIVDTDRCSCQHPHSCELCREDSAYNVFKKKIIILVSEIENKKS